MDAQQKTGTDAAAGTAAGAWPTSRDTIAAVSTAAGRAAVAVIRVSGPAAGAVLVALAGGVPEPRRAVLATLRNASGEHLDRALALWFPAPRSATSEDMAELHIHGGRAVIAAVLEAVWQVPGVRPAEAGEFTRRSFLNGKMDLGAVEGLADLLAAETEGQRRLALAHAFGRLGERVEAWRARLIRAMALIEAGIDFAEEEDVPAEVRAAARPEVEALRAELAEALADRRGELVREGAHVAIAGLPNAGKSSLLNALAARDIAIVSDEPGTTRDIVEVALDLDGRKLVLIDTAGLRETDVGKVEAEGIRRARARIAEADLVLWVHDAGTGPAPQERPAVDQRSTGGLWLLANKSDLVADDVADTSAVAAPWAERGLGLSTRTGAGLDALTTALAGWLERRTPPEGDHPALIRARHRQAAQGAADHLDAALALWGTADEALLAEELRLAASALGRLAGRIDVEDLLDVVFREFCIGK